mgnify:CR=1 FL=1
MYKIAIIIPCRNEVNYIKKAILSIENNNFPIEDVEVVVVDGMSDDGTRELLMDLIQSRDWLRIINNENQKTPFAFNIGLKYTQSKYVLIMGSRFILSSNYLQEALLLIEKYQEVACVGGFLNHIYENDEGKIISFAQSSKFGVGIGNFRTLTKETYTDTVTPPFFKRSIFNEIGHFDERLTRNQDDDFSYRVIKKGYKILFSPNLKTDYFVRTSYKKLFNQYNQYGYWKVFVNRKHRTITTLRQLIPVGFLLSLILLVILGLFNNFFLFILGIEFIIYFTFAIYFSKPLINKLKVIKIIYVFLILHFSYGMGYLLGVFRFIILKKNPQKSFEILTR